MMMIMITINVFSSQILHSSGIEFQEYISNVSPRHKCFSFSVIGHKCVLINTIPISKY